MALAVGWSAAGRATEPAPGRECPTPVGDAAAAGDRAVGMAAGERAARHLLEQARRDIHTGRKAEGCELLVVVATVFATTESGRVAASELGQLPTSNVASGRSGADGQLAGDNAAARWREIVVRATGAQDELREAVGDRVFFGPGSAEIGGRAADALNRQAGWLAVHPVFDVVVEGHADDGLPADGALQLALERAEAVRRSLIEQGLPPERIGVLSLGSSEPVAACDDPQCLAQNRRAVTRLVPAGRVVAAGEGRR